MVSVCAPNRHKLLLRVIHNVGEVTGIEKLGEIGLLGLGHGVEIFSVRRRCGAGCVITRLGVRRRCGAGCVITRLGVFSVFLISIIPRPHDATRSQPI